MKTAITVLSDLHINSTVGLCSEIVKLDDGGSYRSSKNQDWLRESYYHFLKFLVPYNAGADKRVLVINGDIVDYPSKYSSHQNITKNTSDIIKHSLELLSLANGSDTRIFVVRGTEAHVGNAGEVEETIAREIEAEVDEVTGLHSRWNLQLDVNGCLIDFAHHGRIGGRPWNRNSPLYSLGAEMIVEAEKNSRVYPDLVIRSHHHTYADTENALPVRVIQTPCWQLNTAYAHRMGFVNQPSVGGLVILVDEDGKYEVEVAIYDTPQISAIRI